MNELTGHAMDHGWMPHKPETWPYRFAKLKNSVEMWHYKGIKNGEQSFDKILCEAGCKVKIVMVSRFGDVGITEDLSAENGYGARVKLEDLCDWSDT